MSTSADLVVALATYNHAETAPGLVTAALEAMRQCMPGVRCAIVHADGGSTDQTLERVLAAAPDADLLQIHFTPNPAQQLAPLYYGVPGKGAAFRAIFEKAHELDAKACVILDAGLAGMTPDGVASMARPILELQYDFVAPLYARHRFDGAIHSGILYPLTRSLYGIRLREPAGGDIGCGPTLIEELLGEDSWSAGDAHIGVSARALSARLRVCQVNLGPKTPFHRDSTLDVSTLLAQVAGAAFLEMERYAAAWQRVRGSHAVEIFGEPRPAGADPPQRDPHRLIEQFRFGTQNLMDVWSVVLPPATLVELKRIARSAADRFVFPDETWTRTVYDFALAFRLRIINRDHLLRALTPLYLGWLASLITELPDATADEVETRIEKLCQVYESMKPYLISRWRWPDRFTP